MGMIEMQIAFKDLHKRNIVQFDGMTFGDRI